MFTTPPPKKTMVNTRSKASKQLENDKELQAKLQIVTRAQEMPPPTPATKNKDDENKMDKSCAGSIVKSERFVSKPPSHASRHSKKPSSSSSVKAQRMKLELEAAQAKARIEMELIDKKLAADLAELDEEYSPPSKTSERNYGAGSEVERWMERSQQELDMQHATMLGNDKGKLHTSGPADTDGPVQQLASAFKEMVTSSTIQQNTKLLSRISTPKELPIFNGNPIEWLQFKQSYEEFTEVCTFTDRENLWRLRKCLRGPAYDAVAALLISATSPAIVMSTLELQFGNADVILSRIMTDIKRMCNLSADYCREIVPISIKVKNYVAAVRALGREEYLQGMEVANIILSKLPTTLVSKWADYSYPLITVGTPKPRMEVLSEFLTEEAVKISTCSASSLHPRMDNYKRKQYDTLRFDVSFKRIPENIMNGTQKPTKRKMLRVIMSIFDVYSFLSPFTIIGKIILQETWKLKISWDDYVTDAIFTKWYIWIALLQSLRHVRLPRYYPRATANASASGAVRKPVPSKLSPKTECGAPATIEPTITTDYACLQLHIFCDASTKAMCAVAYWRWLCNDCVQVAFITSRCRVAPVKPVTVPRLELQAAVLAARLAEIENIVNSRPLTHVSVDPNSLETLTPNHFLVGFAASLPVIGSFDESDLYLRKQWRISQRLADMYWRRWLKEILPDMLPRTKWHEERRKLQVGDLVLVVDPDGPRNLWPKGLVQEVFPGSDGRVRMVKIKTKSGIILTRSATRVARIPMDNECC